MPNQTSKPEQRKRGRILPALCNVLGVVLLVGVVALCAPIALPPLFGLQVFQVVSGSMEPEIPVGSIVYVQPVDPSQVQVGQVVAYSDGETVVVHRVVTNRTSLGELVTKGDANNTEDLAPVPYAHVVGQVQSSVPWLGYVAALYSSSVGKLYLLLVAACGVMFNLLASRMRR